MFDENSSFLNYGSGSEDDPIQVGGDPNISNLYGVRKKKNKFQTFLGNMTQPTQGGQHGGIMGGLAGMAGQGGVAGGIGKFAKFLL